PDFRGWLKEQSDYAAEAAEATANQLDPYHLPSGQPIRALAGAFVFASHLLHVGEKSGEAWGDGRRLEALGYFGDDAATIAAAALIFSDIIPNRILGPASE